MSDLSVRLIFRSPHFLALHNRSLLFSSSRSSSRRLQLAGSPPLSIARCLFSSALSSFRAPNRRLFSTILLHAISISGLHLHCHHAVSTAIAATSISTATSPGGLLQDSSYVNLFSYLTCIHAALRTGKSLRRLVSLVTSNNIGERIRGNKFHATMDKLLNSPRKSKSKSTLTESTSCYDGESLACFLKSIHREMELARALDTALPDKIWLKQQFSIGVNEVTRVLERMPPFSATRSSAQQNLINRSSDATALPVKLQAILLASDCNPRWLTKHLPCLATSRKVPLIFVKDKKGGSLRLGELVKLKTAIAVGVKAKGNAVNQLVEEILSGDQIHGGEDHCTN